jgi:D-alanine--poly(phosphoribitol) ligase subunit 2
MEFMEGNLHRYGKGAPEEVSPQASRGRLCTERLWRRHEPLISYIPIQKEDAMERVVELLQEIADVQGVDLPSETESLFDAGVLDSFGLLEFLTSVEKELNITIPDEDLIPANFDTIAKLRSYLNDRVEG